MLGVSHNHDRLERSQIRAGDPGDVAVLVADPADPLAVVADPDVELAGLPPGALDRLGRVDLAHRVGGTWTVGVVLDVEVGGYPVRLPLVVDSSSTPPVDRSDPDAESV